MFKIAFSTVACPDWTLDQVARNAGASGYDGVELRTFIAGSEQFACEPGLTDPAKVRAMFFEGGVEPMCLATSISLDEPITPPVLGSVIGDTERPVRLAKSAIELAIAIRCPRVRIFGFELPAREGRSAGRFRIAQRLRLVLDAARNTGVSIVLENGGSFPTARSILDLIGDIPNPLLGVSYSFAVAAAAGEHPSEGIDLLGDRLSIAKVKDFDASRQPCLPGDGQVPLAEPLRLLVDRSFRGWVVFEWDRAWLRGLAEPEQALPEAARRIYALVGATETSPGHAHALT
jgi:sugar phosphate isomerase/epimerase